MKILLENTNTKVIYSSPYHHATNGQIERQFRTIRDTIYLSVQDKSNGDWAEVVPDIEFMLNSTYQTTIEMTPAEAVFGRKIHRQWHGIAPEKVYESTERNFEIGDQVLIKKNDVFKQDNRYFGPGVIEEKLHDRSYKIKVENSFYIRNVEWLKSFKKGRM